MRFVAISIISFIWFFFSAIPALANIQVKDATGYVIHLKKPATRIISLAPNLTEMLYAIGAGQSIVGISTATNIPAAQALPIVGTYNNLDLEKIVALKPSLVIAWQSGNPSLQLYKLRKLHIPVYIAAFKQISDIGKTLINLGILTGKQQQANKQAKQFQKQITKLRTHYELQQPIRVFYQVWHKPLFTISKHSIINQYIRLCGGVNVFADAIGIAPQISMESVIAANPQVILSGENAENGLQQWLKWPQITAVKNKNLFRINPSLIERPSTKVWRGITKMCKDIALARKRLRNV